MKLGSVCTGSGMLDHAVAQVLGATPTWGYDTDPIAAAVASHHLGHDVVTDDIWTADWESHTPVDVFVAGWPCQPFSVAGRQLGADDDRAIWPEVRRAIRALRPRYVLLENVPGILTTGEFGRVADALASLGYEFRWTTLQAADCGAPHRRERVFILGCHAGFPVHEGISAPLIPPVKPMGYLLPTPKASDANRTATANGQAGHSMALADFMLDDEKMHRVQSALARWRNITRRKTPALFQATSRGGRRPSVEFVEWMMGWPAGWVSEAVVPPPRQSPGRSAPITTEAAMRILGNGVVPQQVHMALGRLLNYREEPRVYGID